MRETWVQSLVGEDPICCGATKPEHHNHWSRCSRAWELQLLSLHAATVEACMLQSLCSTAREARVPQLETSPLLLQPEKSPCNNKDSAQSKININYFLKYIDLKSKKKKKSPNIFSFLRNGVPLYLQRQREIVLKQNLTFSPSYLVKF